MLCVKASVWKKDQKRKSLEAQGGLLQGCFRAPGSRGCRLELGAALGKSCGQTLMSPWAEDLANPLWPAQALTRVRGASSLQITVSCGLSAIIALDNGSRRTQSHTKRISSLRVASGTHHFTHQTGSADHFRTQICATNTSITIIYNYLRHSLSFCGQEKPYPLNPLLQAQPLPLHLYVHLFPFSRVQLQKPALFRNSVGFYDYKVKTNSVPTRKSIFKKRRELDIKEAEIDVLVTKESLIWGCRRPELNNCLIPVIHALLHKPGRLYF